VGSPDLPANCITVNSADSQESFLVLSSEAVDALVDDEEPVDPTDSPSAFKVRKVLPEFLRSTPLTGRQPRDQPLSEDAEYRRPNDSPSAKGMRRSEEGAPGPCFGREPHALEEAGDRADLAAGGAARGCTEGEIGDGGGTGAAAAATGPVTMDHTMPLSAFGVPNTDKQWQRFHRLRRKGLLSLIGANVALH